MNVIIICGGREVKDIAALREQAQAYIERRVHPSTLIMTGGARGTDALVNRIALEMGRQPIIIPANWEGHSSRRIAGYERNKLMLTIAQAIANQLGGKVKVVAFPGDKGTPMMVQLAHDSHVPYETIGWTFSPR